MYRAILAAVLIAAGAASASAQGYGYGSGYGYDTRHRSMHHSRGPVIVLPPKPRVVFVPKHSRVIVVPRHRHAAHRVWRSGRWFVR